jgi:hypothetical protein
VIDDRSKKLNIAILIARNAKVKIYEASTTAKIKLSIEISILSDI